MPDDIDLLATEGRDLTADPAATGEKTYGRKDETTALARALAEGRSVVLLGPTGVGKTAVVRKLLSYMREQRVPELDGARVFEISTVGLCADTRYTGQQETRIRALLAHANKKRIVYVTDLWNLPYAGSYSTNPRGIYELMRPGIEVGKLVLFGETTPGRWEKLCREHPSLAGWSKSLRSDARSVEWRSTQPDNPADPDLPLIAILKKYRRFTAPLKSSRFTSLGEPPGYIDLHRTESGLAISLRNCAIGPRRGRFVSPVAKAGSDDAQGRT